MTAPFYQETQIEQGPLVVTSELPEAQSVAIGFFIDVGSRDESEGEAGIAHALEHMLFKGTKSLDVHALSEKLDLLGGHANAFTARERTCFHIHVLYEDWQEAVRLIASMILEPALPAEEWQREREVIFSEMAMVEDTPEEWVFDQHMQALYPGQGIGKPTLGTKEALRATTHDDLRRYLETHYRPPCLLVAAAGRIRHRELVDLLAGIDWPAGGERKARTVPVMQPQLQSLPRSFEQAQLVASWPGIVADSDERPVAWLANQMLGGSMSSHLFREVREKRGLAYGVGSSLSTLSDSGIWSVSCGTDPALLAECLQVINEAMDGFVDTITDASVARARRQLEVQFRMGMESVEGHMLYLGGRFDEPHLLSHLQWIEKTNAVTASQIRDWVTTKLSEKPMWSIAAPADVLQSVKNLV